MNIVYTRFQKIMISLRLPTKFSYNIIKSFYTITKDFRDYNTFVRRFPLVIYPLVNIIVTYEEKFFIKILERMSVMYT